MVEFLFVDGNDADLDRTHGFIQIHAERDALYLRGLRYQLFDVSLEIFKAAVVVNGGDIILQLLQALGFYINHF